MGKDASTTGHAFFGRSVDYSTLAADNLQVFPQGSFKRGQWLTDPYERQKYGKDVNYSYLFSHDSYRFLAAPALPFSYRLLPSDVKVYHSAGINEKGVAVSAANTTALRREAEVKDNAYTKKGIAESFAAMILLAEADSARDGVRRMGEIVERDGVGDKEGFLLMIGDSQEVWIFETLGHRRWVASRVPDDKFLVVANDTVTDYVDLNDPEHYLGSADIKEFAIKQGFAIYGPKGSGHEKDVNLAASYGGLVNDPLFNTYRRWRGYQLFAPSQKIDVKKGQSDIYPMFVKPDHKISPMDEMNFHRDRYEGTAYDRSTEKQTMIYPNGYEGRIKMDEEKKLVRPMGVEVSSTVHILELNGYPAEIGGRLWYCLAPAEDAVFLPYYGNETDVPLWSKIRVDGNYRIVKGKRYSYPRYQPDSAASLQMKLGPKADFSRLQYTIELMGRDYAAFGNDPERVRQELRLFIGDKELIGPDGLVPLQEAVQKNAVQVLGDAQRATVTVNFYAIDDAGSPLWQSGMLIVPDGQKDQNIRFTVYAASMKRK